MLENKIPHMLLPKQISVQTGIPVYRIRKWVQEGKIVHVYCGRKVLINYDKFIEFLNNGETNHKDS